MNPKMVPQKRHQNEILKLVTTWFILKLHATLEKCPQKEVPFLALLAETVDPKTEQKKTEDCASVFFKNALRKLLRQQQGLLTRACFNASEFGCKATWYSFSCAKQFGTLTSSRWYSKAYPSEIISNGISFHPFHVSSTRCSRKWAARATATCWETLLQKWGSSA